MPNGILILSESEIGNLISLNDAIEALRRILPLEMSGKARNMKKTLTVWEPRSSIHGLGSVDLEGGFGGFKSWVNTPIGARAVFVLFDAVDGDVLAVMQANTLGLLRTAGISGLATDLLADPQARRLTIIGTGRQALSQVAAISTVRPIERIHVFSRTETNKSAFCSKLEKDFGVEVVEESDAATAVQRSPIVTLVTRAEKPFFDREMIRPGLHVNAIGAIVPGFYEIEPGALTGFGLIAIDNIDNAKAASSELIDYAGGSDERWAEFWSLGALVDGAESNFDRSRATCFKAMGMGLSDLAIAIAAYRKAIEGGQGTRFEGTAPMLPRWMSLRDSLSS